MALKISFGNGALGDVTELDSTVNSCANVTAVTPTSITVNDTTKITGLATFDVGTLILLHVSATSANKKEFLGNWLLATITGIEGDVWTLDTDPTTCITSEELGNYCVQAVAVAQFKNLTLNEGTTITPPIYSASTNIGGIVAIMCSETLTFNGGHISLSDRGIPAASKAMRPATNNDVASDTENYSGWENSDTRIHMFLNAGDGLAFIVAKKLVCNEDSRIGNVTTQGVQFYRGHKNSVTYEDAAPANVTNVGGSTIFVAAETIEGFTCKMFAKYRDSSLAAGQGICRCYIASETKLRNDEGLYAYDCLSDPGRIRKMNIKGFGNGSFGDGNAITAQLNNYATITEVNGRKVTYKNQTSNGLAQIASGALVMIHFNHRSNVNVEQSGRFILANVLADNGTVLTLDADVPNISVTDYAAQIVSIPQFDNFTLAAENKATVAFDGNQGGICALAVKNNCDLSGGKLNVEKKGGGNPYKREGLAFIGNAQDSDKLPIGQGHGSIFILAHNLTMNAKTRIGKNVATDNTGKTVHGYKGRIIDSGSVLRLGSGADGGKYSSTSTEEGGYGSSGGDGKGKPQGAHIMIVADTITGFTMSALLTGAAENASSGYGGIGGTSSTSKVYGGYNGGSSWNVSAHRGGSSGWAFVYCNNVINQDVDGTIREN